MRHLLGIEPLTPAEIGSVLDDAEAHFVADATSRRDVLRGRTVVLGFFEASTRTRSSFELAAKRLGADVLAIGSSGSSVTKGESLVDTVRNLEAMHVDLLVVRHAASGAAELVASACRRAGVVNAGDGSHEHPTQALLDAFTVRRHKKTLSGLKIAVCGDIEHSRVARSDALLFGKMGSEVWLFGPRTLVPRDAAALGPTVRVARSFDEALEGADVIVMLRIQTERLGEQALLASARDYARSFGLNARRLRLAKPDALVMHPGPINRGVELASDVADGPQSVILDQVAAGVAVRAAVLARLGAAS